MSSGANYDTITNNPVTDKIRDTEYVFENGKLPSDIPHVKEIGATTGPLYSASFFIAARCQDFNDDFMMCQAENGRNGPIKCMKEGRRVTRCAASVLQDLNTHCFKEFQLHYQCLNQGNMEFKNCRSAEKLLNKCVFQSLQLKKDIPDGDYQKLLDNQIYKPPYIHYPSEHAYKVAQREGNI